MTTSITDKAFSLNNQGVAHFENGNYDQARTLFREALEAIKLGMAGLNTDAETSSSASNVGFQWSKNAPLHADLNLSVPAEASFIFRRALIIVPMANESPRPSSFHEESTGIIYNLALSYLVSGFLMNSSSLLNKARKFFEIVVAMRQRRNESSKLGGERLLDTAIWNNLGWISEEFCNYDVAQECYQQVSNRLVALSNSGAADKHDCEGFITNLVSDAHPKMAAAA